MWVCGWVGRGYYGVVKKSLLATSCCAIVAHRRFRTGSRPCVSMCVQYVSFDTLPDGITHQRTSRFVQSTKWPLQVAVVVCLVLRTGWKTPSFTDFTRLVGVVAGQVAVALEFNGIDAHSSSCRFHIHI